ncbi:4Fe-4S dicluster domain-containing protein [Thermococcus alcaliphilus]|uniref:4Fe-4S dicluster domain-containing protein n=1 Tax=Thermococcus alcaliphilus TaxID=139207 RepID=UPI0020919B08|nr:4Fe-4S dicluster domain-containing protein [Thermococcus alcaliphilus]MCO6041399.1 4Fe-4S dicluster domain-containing protein [Thermococcus alcaliphilus]
MSLKAKLARKFVYAVFPDVRRYTSIKPAFENSPNSPEGRLVPEVVALYGKPGVHILKMVLVLPYLVGTAYYARKSVTSVRKNPGNGKKTAPPEFFEELESYAKSLGVLKVGYTKLTPELVFSNRAVLFENAIVLIGEMRKGEIAKAPGIRAGIEVWRTYYRLTRAAYKIAEFLRERGYNAQPDPAVGGSTNFPLLAQKAGLGHIGKHGLLITPENGPSVRIGAVYTDLELPYTDERVWEYEWIPDFCDRCNACVRACPAQAIYITPKRENSREVHIDYKKCAVVFSRTLGCSVCVKECTFTKGSYGKIKGAYEKIAKKEKELGK